MPMVGTDTASVTMRATSSGTPSSTIAKQPASSERVRVVDERERRRSFLALHLEAAHGVDRLRREAEVSHHRDLGVDDRLDHREPLAPALELHRLRAGADERRGVAHRVLDATRGS